MDERMERLLPVLPRALSAQLRRLEQDNPTLFGRIGEVRLRRGRAASVSAGGREILLPVTVKEGAFDDCFRALCGPSLYVQELCLREGYLHFEGMRVGVAGRAVCEGDALRALADVSSLCIRIPHRVRGAGDAALRLFRERGGRAGMLVYAPPGVGKTTLLCDLALSLATGDGGHTVALIDTRRELYDPEIPPAARIDCLTDYPIAVGVLQAVRVLSPSVIVCDEIGREEEADAILSVAGAGVPIIASAHASCVEELALRPPIRRLLDAGIFPLLLGIARQGEGYSYHSSVWEGGGERCYASRVHSF